MRAQNGKVTMGSDFLSCAPKGDPTHTKTDSIADFNSLLVCSGDFFFFFSVVFRFSFKFYQEVLLLAEVVWGDHYAAPLRLF